ncbi:hypothetical protein LZ32DRAFT_160976 [Colletotrichum eremochloae]|nr:hypothetical protein LZ32DRAFT_160976 [Colletotrichum eremochloae]
MHIHKSQLRSKMIMGLPFNFHVYLFFFFFATPRLVSFMQAAFDRQLWCRLA